MTVKYLARDAYKPIIEVVTIVSETSKFVTRDVPCSNGLRRKRFAKASERECYFDTRIEAKGWLVSVKRNELEIAKRRLDYARNKLQEAEIV